MKYLLIIILLLIATTTYPQKQSWDRAWEKATFRETPGTGETMAIFGVGFMSAGAISAFGKDSKANIVSGAFGLALCVSGVYIEINREATKYKYKHKVKGRLFASGSGIKIQLNF